MKRKSENDFFSLPVVRVALTPDQNESIKAAFGNGRGNGLGYVQFRAGQFTLVLWGTEYGATVQALEAAGIIAKPSKSGKKSKRSKQSTTAITDYRD